MRIPWILFALALPILLVAGDDPDEMTRVTVEVKTLSGKPVERAAVTVRFVEGRSIAKFGKKITKQWELRTNHEGVAKVPELPKGKLMVMVHAKGFQTFGEVFEVLDAEKTLQVQLKPPQSQYSAH
jgi:hypothetical protein